MIVLGIHDGHDASACVMADGKLVAMAQEERFSRLKMDYGYPYHAINSCLNQARIAPQDIDQVAVATEHFNPLYYMIKAHATFTIEDWLEFNTDYWKPLLYEKKENKDYYTRLLARQKFRDLWHYYDFSEIDGGYDPRRDRHKVRKIRLDGIRRHLNIGANKVGFYDHHTCHAYYALFGSHIRCPNTLVYTLDGGGDRTVSTLFRFRDGKMEELARSNHTDIVRIYRYVPLLLGMKPAQHAYKVMGLAPYANDREMRKSWAVFDDMFEIKDDMICYREGRRPKDHYFFFKEVFEGHRFDGIAGAAQRMVEENVSRWILQTQEKYGSRHAVLGGGVAMNVKLNMLVAECGQLEDFYVCPSPTDDTLCIGACYMAELAKEPGSWESLEPITDAYLGPSFTPKEVGKAIEDAGLARKYEIVRGVTPEYIADLLVRDLIVACLRGRMEFGARALGNRSILANPTNVETVRRINDQIKYRDFWMPFAPVILAECEDDYLDRRNTNIRRPYMMIASHTKQRARREIPAALHPADKTIRPQILSRDQNPDYWEIAKAFERRTGIGALLNTSFNLHGEPIVCSPEDAIGVFEYSELDALVMEDVAVLRTRRS